MESNKLGKKIRDWATSLGFRLADGSAPPADFFDLLTATPHRRLLWEAIVESVLQRQKVEHMRKQILVAKLLDRKKFFKRDYSKQITDRIELWHKQNSLETCVKEKRNEIFRLEENVLVKASDLVFEICKLAELEKQFEELSDKILILKLFSKKRKIVLEELKGKLLTEKGVSDSEGMLENHKENSDFIVNQLLNIEKCINPVVDYHSCSLLNKIEQLCNSGTTEQYLWEVVVKYKKNLLEKFSEFLVQLNSREKDILSEKVAEVEKNLCQLVIQLKQKVTSKSLQVIVNSVKGKHLEFEIERLKERLMNKDPHNVNFNEAISFLSSYGINESYEENEKNYKNLNIYLSELGFKRYQEFLRGELNRLEDELMRRKKDSVNGTQEVQQTLKSFESIAGEINSYKSEERETGEGIFRHHEKLVSQLLSIKKETERMVKTKTVEEAAEKLKSASEKQIEVFLEIPQDAFRTLESNSGRVIFECESECHCLENYGGELKQFFSSVLIPPLTDVSKITEEVRKRKQIVNEIKMFISGRDKLTLLERKVQKQMSSVKYDSRLCEKNFEESDGILWNISSKTEQLLKEIEFVEKILKNWLEQPYRSMITAPIQGNTLKEFEEQYKKGKI